jgi:hypothetical protein
MNYKKEYNIAGGPNVRGLNDRSRILIAVFLTQNIRSKMSKLWHEKSPFLKFRMIIFR